MAVGVRVNGLRDLIKRLDRAGVELSDLKAVMHDVGLMIADTARPLTRPQSGRLARSIRSAKQKNCAIVRATTPYARVQHFGWPKRHIKPKLYFYTAMDKRRDEVLSRFQRGIDEAIHK